MASSCRNVTRRFCQFFGLDIEKCTKLGNSKVCLAQPQRWFSPNRPKAQNVDCMATTLGTGHTAKPKRRCDKGIIKKENQVAKSKPDDTESIIRKFQRIHGGTFDYSKVDYFNHTTKVIIICRRHGPFEQQPRLHLRGSTGCRQCIAERGK